MYAKLILRNAKRSIKDYLIYIVTMTICVTLFYAFLSISSSFYHPGIGAEYDYTILGDGMKMAVIAVTLLLLFLIKYVNNYMLIRRQKEFAVQTVMGMEQKTVGWMFFAETFVMGLAAIGFGILGGMVCSQFITAMLLSTYGEPYRFSWMLFPDTAVLTILFFSLSFLLVGLFNVLTIRKIKVTDMLYAEHHNEKSIKKSRWMPTIIVLYVGAALFMFVIGIEKKHFYFDSRLVLPVRVMFWGNIVAPLLTVVYFVICLFHRKRWGFHRWIAGLLFSSVINACFAVSVPRMRSLYMLAIGSGTVNQYLMFVLADLIFIVCCIICLASFFLEAWKEKRTENIYKKLNLFFFGQIISKLNSTTKTMTLICLTFVLAIFLFVAAPALVGWSRGYLEVRSLYDIQISSQYNDVYEESDLETGDYELVSDFLSEQKIEAQYDLVYNLYLPRREDFHVRNKYEFPVVAVSLSDYNSIREMLGLSQITLKKDEFTTQWQSIATEEERKNFLNRNATVSTDNGVLKLAEEAYYLEPIGETIYNTYTDVLYVFPDAVCESLLPVIRNRYIQTVETLSHDQAVTLQKMFEEQYPETVEGVHYYIRTSTEQINSNKASNFILQTTMIYGAVVLVVICLTILSLQQLMDAPYYKYRFGVLRKLGVDEQDIGKLIMKQLAVWFGLPIFTAIIISVIIVTYFLQMISVQIAAYVGFGELLLQILAILCILLGLFICYFISTWTMFRRSI